MTTQDQKKTTAQTEHILLSLIDSLVVELHPRAASKPITLDSSFDSELGLDSLARMELLARVEEQFGISLPERALIDAASPRDVLRAIQHARPPTPQDPKPLDSVPSDITSSSRRDSSDIPHHAQTLIDILKHHASLHPDRLHIRFYDDTSEGKLLTFGDLHEKSQLVANGLQQRGLKAEEPVAIMLPTSKEYFFAFFGILLAGGIPVPLYPPVQQAKLEEHLRRHRSILTNCDASTLISIPEAKPFARLLQTQVPSLQHFATVEELSSPSDASLHPKIHPTHTAFLQYTSGSTGNPKGVVLSHANLLTNIRTMGQVINATPNDVFVSWLPLYHDMGLIGAWLGSLYFGAQLVIMSPLEFLSRPLRWLTAIHRYKGTLSASPNFGYELCLRRIPKENLQAINLRSLRALFNGAEPVSPDTIRNFTTQFAITGLQPEIMKPVYGLAEGSVGLAFPPMGRGPRIDCIERESFQRKGLAIPASVTEAKTLQFVASGQAIPNHEIRVVDDKGRELPERQVGQIHFRGPSSTSGYFRNPEQTAKLFKDGWLNTGDVGYMTGGDVYITGRIKDIIIRAGRNIAPQELEEAIGNLDGVRKGCVVVFGSHTSDVSGTTETEHLIVLAETRTQNPALRQQLTEQITALSLELTGTAPDEIQLVPSGTVLKTSSGKLRRAATKERYEQGTLQKSTGPLWFRIAKEILIGLPSQFQRFRRSVAEWTFATWAWTIFGSMALFGVLTTTLVPTQKYRWKTLHILTRLLGTLTRTRLTIKGLENIPKDTNHIFVANHASYLDVYALTATLPVPFSFVAKGELAQSPLIRFLLKRLHTEFVERFDKQRSVEDAHHLTQLATAGTSLLFFAEGTFRRAPGLRPFQLGAFATAAQSNIPIVPIAIKGTRSMLRDGSWLPRRGRITITIGPAIHPAAPTEDATSPWSTSIDLQNQTREFILQHCGEPDLSSETKTILPPT